MLVLGSKSPRRKMLTEEKITKDFLVFSPDIDEDISYSLPTPLKAVRDIAKRKCLFCKEHFPNELIICADTIVVLGNEILHKPIDEKDAYNILKKLSNKTHQVITAYAINYKDKLILNHVISDVTFNDIKDELILSYIKSGSPMDKAGAYGIQDNNEFPIIKSYSGSYENIVGFPTDEILTDIKNISK